MAGRGFPLHWQKAMKPGPKIHVGERAQDVVGQSVAHTSMQIRSRPRPSTKHTDDRSQRALLTKVSHDVFGVWLKTETDNEQSRRAILEGFRKRQIGVSQ